LMSPFFAALLNNFPITSSRFHFYV
jgi:hypothetical protein